MNVVVKLVRTSNGKIGLEGTRGDTEVETSNEKIEVKDSAGDIDAHTSNGAIELAFASGLNANIEVRTSNGKIKFEDFEVMVKEISKNTFRGRIGDGGKKISCRTSNGRIVLKNRR